MRMCLHGSIFSEIQYSRFSTPLTVCQISFCSVQETHTKNYTRNAIFRYLPLKANNRAHCALLPQGRNMFSYTTNLSGKMSKANRFVFDWPNKTHWYCTGCIFYVSLFFVVCSSCVLYRFILFFISLSFYLIPLIQ